MRGVNASPAARAREEAARAERELLLHGTTTVDDELVVVDVLSRVRHVEADPLPCGRGFRMTLVMPAGAPRGVSPVTSALAGIGGHS